MKHTVATLALLFLSSPMALHAQPLPDFTGLVERTSPAVVNISTAHRVMPPAGEEGDESHRFDELFRRFFGEEGVPPPAQEPFDANSLGSGFLLSADGAVLTNYHVVHGAEEILVTLSDRRQFIAELVGFDEDSDLALLQVEANGLPAADVGTSEQLKVGEWVYAIGSPFGFEHSVTVGVVSAKARALRSERFVPFIQTDVAINPGNSGGPLFNLRGEVVGINSQIFSRTGGFQGVSFAIPIEIALDVVAQLRESGRVSRGWLGVNIQDVTRELAESFRMARPEGALVTRVVTDSPAERAGLRVGDVIVMFDGQAVPRSATLPQLVGGTRAHRTVQVVILREGRRRNLDIALGELDPPERVAAVESEGPRPPGALGIVVADIDAEEREARGLDDYGVLVTEVGRGAAYQSGLRTGDVILMYGQVRVRDPMQFDELVAATDGDRPVAVLVQRNGVPVFLAVRSGDDG